jgi:hypothetical protein
VHAVSFGLEIQVVIAEKELAEGVMIDTSTGERLLVSTAPDAGPYIDLPYSQVEEVCKRLDRAGVSYWVDPWVISVDGDPEITTIYFSRYVDADRIQAALDETS